MATDTPKRLYGPAQLASSAATVYTVPASTTAILRYMIFTNTTGTDRSITVSVGADAAATRIISAVTIPTGGFIEWAGFIPMTAGEVVQASAAVATAITAVICGVETA